MRGWLSGSMVWYDGGGAFDDGRRGWVSERSIMYVTAGMAVGLY